MKNLMLSLVAILMLAACGSSHHTELVVDKTNNGLQIVHYADSFERYRGQYHVFTMVRNVSQKTMDQVQVTANYFDESGKSIGSSIGGPGRVLSAGDSAIIDNQWVFPTPESLPYKVKISVSNGDK